MIRNKAYINQAMWLASFYEMVSNGGIPQRYIDDEEWQDAAFGPDMQSSPEDWRVVEKPREWTIAVDEDGNVFPVKEAKDWQPPSLVLEYVTVREVVEK